MAADTPEISLLELMLDTLPLLPLEARDRVLTYLSSWMIDKAREKGGSTGARSAAFKIIADAFGKLTGEEASAVLASFNVLMAPTPAPEPPSEPKRAAHVDWIDWRWRVRTRKCKLCKSTEHDIRFHRKEAEKPREKLLEMD